MQASCEFRPGLVRKMQSQKMERRQVILNYELEDSKHTVYPGMESGRDPAPVLSV